MKSVTDKVRSQVVSVVSITKKLLRTALTLTVICLALSLCSTRLSAQSTRSTTLTWATSTTPNVTYNVWRATVMGGEDSPATATLLNPVPLTTLTFTDTTVMSGITYYYVVRSVNSTGTASTDSNEVMAVIVPLPAAPPAPPSELKITIN